MQNNVLIFTFPLNRLCTIVQGTGMQGLREKSAFLQHLSTHIVGLGLYGEMTSQLLESAGYPWRNEIFNSKIKVNWVKIKTPSLFY